MKPRHSGPLPFQDGEVGTGRGRGAHGECGVAGGEREAGGDGHVIRVDGGSGGVSIGEEVGEGDAAIRGGGGLAGERRTTAPDARGVRFGEGGGSFVKVRSFLREQIFVDSGVKVAALSFGEDHCFVFLTPKKGTFVPLNCCGLWLLVFQ